MHVLFVCVTSVVEQEHILHQVIRCDTLGRSQKYVPTLTHLHCAKLRMDTGFCGIWDQAIMFALLKVKTWFAAIQETNLSSIKSYLLVIFINQ